MVGIYWVNHHHLLRSTERISGSVMWSNLFLLFWLSLFPIVTAWVGRFPRAALPAACYGLVGLGAGAAYSFLVRMIIRTDGPDSVVGRSIGTDRKGYVSLVLYIVGAAAGPPLHLVVLCPLRLGRRALVRSRPEADPGAPAVVRRTGPLVVAAAHR